MHFLFLANIFFFIPKIRLILALFIILFLIPQTRYWNKVTIFLSELNIFENWTTTKFFVNRTNWWSICLFLFIVYIDKSR